MKKLYIFEIISALISLPLMCLPLYSFCFAPLLLIASSVYFAYKHNSRFVLWRAAVIDLFMLIGYRVNIYFVDLKNTIDAVDYISYSILFVPFVVSIIIASIIFLIYQLILLIGNKSLKAHIKVLLSSASVILTCALTAVLIIANNPMSINSAEPENLISSPVVEDNELIIKSSNTDNRDNNLSANVHIYCFTI